MKILYVDPNANPKYPIKYAYYTGLPIALIEAGHEVFFFSGPSLNVKNINMSDIDLVFFGLGWFNHQRFFPIPHIEKTTAITVFKPQIDLDKKISFCKNSGINYCFTPVPYIIEKMTENGLSSTLLPYGFDPEIFHDRCLPKTFDVGFSGALHQSKYYPTGSFANENIRMKIHEAIKESGVSFFWNGSDSISDRINDYEDYAKKIGSCKVWIATKAAFGDVTPRFYEVLASGTVLLCEETDPEYDSILVDDYNCVKFKADLSDFSSKLLRLANDDEYRKRIAENAVSDSQMRHTWQHRARHVERIILEGL